MKTRYCYVIHSLFSLAFVCLFTISHAYSMAPQREFYEIKVYHIKDKSQEERVDKFLQNAYLPALHRAGIDKVGVFKPIESDTTAGKRIYVFIPLSSVDQLVKLPQTLADDKQFASAGKDYLEAAHDNPPYTRMESIILQAFPGKPTFSTPDLKNPHNERVYELRSYEGPTEMLYKNKVQMFNKGGEVKLFDRLGFNAVFYAEVVAGSHMPNLMYMTTFSDMESRDKHWDAFSNDPVWKNLTSMSEYQHNVSHADIFLLHPTDYSDI